jgi:hypothetical protein
MNRVHVLVEGQTEEAFVGRCLRPHLWAFDVDVSPKIVVTRRVQSGADQKGGVSSWGKIERDLRLLLGDTSVVAVTTLLDYYGLPSDVPGMATRPEGMPEAKAFHVESAIEDHIGDPRLRANLLIHEFEALLYSDPATCGAYLGSPRLAEHMQSAVDRYGAPELVNDNPQTAPSKRIKDAHLAYQKVLHGPALADEIGLDRIRETCPHFAGWVNWLEKLGD